ncbi:bifunctional ADP-dependent NAD(P)H-hydrate dehydratase/NAD(P)H-hydrate epimerase [Propioniciclava soli]|uniref:bifunctional ADP-dependent NAD(P)H-hydrate dehydratase/NAD(P)H-hydrate epimerase n=1 Tax=Propioniciclava soli TaxID=2775081 RepID=UPI001E6461F4|nr:bifunctional ADP-dependent NAD(P)H-hydrate dehydratase/NAD(P)H-hydrate epimerase [Propioniciclava soli]
MLPVVSAQDIRDAEQAWFDAHPGGDLMAVAADAVARAAAELLSMLAWYSEPPTPRGGADSADGPTVVLVVAGPGNNAGDALFALAGLPGLLPDTELDLVVWPCAGATHDVGLAAAQDAGARTVDADAALGLVPGAALVIDGVSGLGGRPGLEPAVLAVADACRAHGTPVLAVDLPSGLVADSHEAHACFTADLTVTFIAHKPAHVLAPASGHCGEVRLVDIGVAAPASDLHLVEESDCAAWYPTPDASSDKYSRGVVGIDTGTDDYPGAAVLGVAGALWSGAGMVRYAGPSRPADFVLAAHPSVVVPVDPADPGRVQAWVCGSGWPGPDAERLARRVADDVPVVVDAGALGALPTAAPDGLPVHSVLTPHAGELARLLEVERAEVEADPLTHARRAARQTGATVLLKGANQFAVEPDGTALLALPGTPWTATAGSGDVLAGIVGTCVAAGLPAARAAVLGASLQAATARAERAAPIPPDRLAEHLGVSIERWCDSLRP